MLDVEQIANHYVQQQPLLLQERDQVVLVLGDLVEIQLDPQHQSPPSNLFEQQRVFALELPQALLQAIAHRSHMAHQSLVVHGQLADRRQCRPAGKRVARECGTVPQVEVLGVGFLGVEARADRHQAAAERLGKEKDVGSHALRFAGKQSPGSAEPGLHFVDNEQRAVAAAEVANGGQITGRRDTNPQTLPG